MRKALELQQPQDHGVVVVVAGVPEMAVAEQDVNHEAENHQGIAIGVGRLELAETLLEAGRESEPSEEGLKQDQAGEGGQLLVFEAELGKGAGFTFDLSSAKLHGGGLQGLVIVSIGEIDYNPKGPPFGVFLSNQQRLNFTCGEIEERRSKGHKGPDYGAFLLPSGFCNATGG